MSRMTIGEAKRLLALANLEVVAEVGLPDDNGKQLRMASGQVVNVYNSGTCTVQGTNPEIVRAALGLARPDETENSSHAPENPDTALYKPELKGRHIVSVTVDEIRRVARLIEDFVARPCSCTIILSDGYVRQLSVDALCAHENSPRQPIRQIEIEADAGDREPNVEFRIMNFDAENVEVEIYGQHEKVETLRRAIEDRLHAMTPGYAWFARRDTSLPMFVAIVGIVIAWGASRWGLVLVLVATTALLSPPVWRRCFPRTTFRIGQGEKRYQSLDTMRTGVLLALLASFVGSAVLVLIGL